MSIIQAVHKFDRDTDVDSVQGGGYQQAEGALWPERTPRNSHSHVSILRKN